MARPVRIICEGAVYHVALRGIERDVLSVVCGMDRAALFYRCREAMYRPLAAQALCDNCGLTQRQVARRLLDMV